MGSGRDVTLGPLDVRDLRDSRRSLRSVGPLALLAFGVESPLGHGAGAAAPLAGQGKNGGSATPTTHLGRSNDARR